MLTCTSSEGPCPCQPSPLHAQLARYLLNLHTKGCFLGKKVPPPLPGPDGAGYACLQRAADILPTRPARNGLCPQQEGSAAVGC